MVDGRTVVFHHGALGDSVLVWPMLRGLGAATFIAPRGKSRLAAQWIDGVEAVDGDDPRWSRLFSPGAIDVTVACLSGATRIISFVSTGDDAWAANVAALAPQAQRLYVRPRPSEGEARHVTAFHRDQLRAQGVTIEPIMPARRENAHGAAVVHPGSGGAAKCWPAERFDAVIGRLIAAGRRVTVLIGEVERERLDPRWLTRWRAGADVVEPDDLIELSRVIAGASVYLGNDSGPTHLAAALGVRTVALFGPTDARVWSPVGPNVTTIAPSQACGMQWIGIEQVMDEVG